MAKSPVIAVAAIKYYDTAKTHNLEKIKKFIALAKRRGADIVCFPESCIKKKGSISLDSRFIKEIRAECKNNSIWCIITEDIKKGRKTFNTALLINREGGIKGQYDKIHLFGDMTSAGNRIKVFKTDFATIGIVICWDLTYPEMFTKMKEKGAEIVFCPAQWNYDTPAHKSFPKAKETKLLRAMVLARAHENILYVALCNPLIDYEAQISYSAIADPHRIVKELINKEGIITAKASIGKVRKFRKYYYKD